MKETELWQRLQGHLGQGYYRVWASQYSLADLGNRTVEVLLDGHANPVGHQQPARVRARMIG